MENYLVEDELTQKEAIAEFNLGMMDLFGELHQE